jgi:hypothetical protein
MTLGTFKVARIVPMLSRIFQGRCEIFKTVRALKENAKKKQNKPP